MKMMITLSATITLLLSGLFTMMVEMNQIKKEKKNSFECGFESLSEKKSTFSTNFIMLMLMFLIFDVEISILIPLLTMNKNNQTMTLLMSCIFIILLSGLTMKEWKQGSLEWMK